MKIFTILFTALLLMNFACNSTKKSTETITTTKPLSTSNVVSEVKKEAQEVVTNTTNTEMKKTNLNTTQPNNETKIIKEKEVVTNTTSTNNEPNEPNTNNGTNAIFGEYVWVKTICCGRLRNVTTAKSDTERVLKFKADGKMVKIENNARVAERAYNYMESGTIYPGRPQLNIEGKSQDALVRYEDGMLVLDYQYMDLQLEYYKKVN